MEEGITIAEVVGRSMLMLINPSFWKTSFFWIVAEVGNLLNPLYHLFGKDIKNTDWYKRHTDQDVLNEVGAIGAMGKGLFERGKKLFSERIGDVYDVMSATGKTDFEYRITDHGDVFDKQSRREPKGPDIKEAPTGMALANGNVVTMQAGNNPNVQNVIVLQKQADNLCNKPQTVYYIQEHGTLREVGRETAQAKVTEGQKAPEQAAQEAADEALGTNVYDASDEEQNGPHEANVGGAALSLIPHVLIGNYLYKKTTVAQNVRNMGRGVRDFNTYYKAQRLGGVGRSKAAVGAWEEVKNAPKLLKGAKAAQAAKAAKGLTSLAKVGAGAGVGLVGMGMNYAADKWTDAGSTANVTLKTLGTAAEWGSMGAMVGSVIPGIGTTVGAVVGGLAGAAYGWYQAKNKAKEVAQARKDAEKELKNEGLQTVVAVDNSGPGDISRYGIGAGKAESAFAKKTVQAKGYTGYEGGVANDYVVQKPVETPKVAQAIGENTETVNTAKASQQNGKIEISDFNINVGGAITLNFPNGASQQINSNELLNNQEFVDQMTKLVSSNIQQALNGGRSKWDVSVSVGALPVAPFTNV
jgi:hypothetical protein